MKINYIILISTLVFYIECFSYLRTRNIDLDNSKFDEIRNISKINLMKDLNLPAPFQKESNMLIHDLFSGGKLYVGLFPQFQSPAWLTLFHLYVNFDNKNSFSYINDTVHDNQDYSIYDNTSLVYQGRKVEIRGYDFQIPRVIDINFCSCLDSITKEVYLYIVNGKSSYVSYEKQSRKGGIFLGFLFSKYLSNLFDTFEEAEKFVFEKTDVDFNSFKRGYKLVDCCLRKFPILKQLK